MVHPVARPDPALRRVASRFAAPVAIALLAFFAFASVLPGARFAFDDHVLIEKNQLLHRGDVWWKAFGRDYFETSESAGGSGYYRPVAVMFDATDIRVWGRYRIWGYHATNLVLHTAASLAVAPALVALGATPPVAWIAAAFFAVHPSHAESVAFVSGRGDVLAGLWTFVALALFVSRRRFAGVGFGIAVFLAYLSKEAAVVLPLLVALVWWGRARRGASEDNAPIVVRAVVLGAVSLVALLLRYAALGRFLPASAADQPSAAPFVLPLQSLAFAILSTYAPLQRLAMEPSPAGLSIVRVAMGIIVAAVVWLAARWFDPASRPFLRRAAIASVVAVLPVLNWLPQETRLSERFLYIASAFAMAPVGVLVWAGWRRSSAIRPLAAGAAGLAIVLLIGMSAWRARAWRDDIVLWRIATAEEPQRGLFWNRYGLALMERRMFPEAQQALQRAIELDPRDAAAMHYLGMVLHQTERPMAAIDEYRRALAVQPRNVYILLNIALSQMSIGDLRGTYASAQQALAIDPNHFEALRMAGGCALQLNLLPEARRYLEAAAQQNRDNRGLAQQLEVLRRREAGLEPPSPVPDAPAPSATPSPSGAPAP